MVTHESRRRIGTVRSDGRDVHDGSAAARQIMSSDGLLIVLSPIVTLSPVTSSAASAQPSRTEVDTSGSSCSVSSHTRQCTYMTLCSKRSSWVDVERR